MAQVKLLGNDLTTMLQALASAGGDGLNSIRPTSGGARLARKAQPGAAKCRIVTLAAVVSGAAPMLKPLRVLPLLALAGCAPEPQAFSLNFAAVSDGVKVGCIDSLAGLGTGGNAKVGINDLRFYVSNVKLLDAAGKEVEVTLDEDAFQYSSAAGQVSLIDLTGNTDGTCAGSTLGFSEGTARTHTAITGKTVVSEVKSISFDVGVPQPLMKKVIADNTLEGAPSPLAEMHWSWAGGYRHFVFNFAVTDGANASGEGYLHIGSNDCAAMGNKALEDRDVCGLVNTPKVALSSFDLTKDTVGIDLARALQGLDFISPVYDANFNVIGQGPGVECHSSASQEDCPTIFSSFGTDIAAGTSTASSNAVFVRIQ
ncbi:MAG: MbnP family copper-binding protein [Archangium sp.]